MLKALCFVLLLSSSVTPLYAFRKKVPIVRKTESLREQANRYRKMSQEKLEDTSCCAPSSVNIVSSLIKLTITVVTLIFGAIAKR